MNGHRFEDAKNFYPNKKVKIRKSEKEWEPLFEEKYENRQMHQIGKRRGGSLRKSYFKDQFWKREEREEEGGIKTVCLWRSLSVGASLGNVKKWGSTSIFLFFFFWSKSCPFVSWIVPSKNNLRWELKALRALKVGFEKNLTAGEANLIKVLCTFNLEETETFFLFLKICKSPNDAIQRTQASTSIKTT